MSIKTQDQQSPIKLDLIDKKILLALSQNSRTPKTKLAKQLKISIQRLEYKLKRLYESIIHPVLILNYSELKIQEHLIFAKTLSQESLKKLQTSPNIFFLAEFVGKYSYLIYILTNDIKEFKIKYLPNELVETHPIISFQNDTYNPFNLKTTNPKETKSTPTKLNHQDYKILYQLYQNPLENYINLAEKTRLDWRTVKIRIENLLASKTIDRFKIAYNVFALNHLNYFIKITTPEIHKQKIKQIVKRNNYSGFLHESYDHLFLQYMPPTHNELLEFTKSLESISSKIKTDINQIVNYKIQTTPKFILEEFSRKSKQL